MSGLIFCSYEVGGLPYKMAEILNRHGIETQYLSTAKGASGHDSTAYHLGERRERWDLSHLVRCGRFPWRDVVALLKRIKGKYRIAHVLGTGDKAFLLARAEVRYKYWSYGSDLDRKCFAPDWSPTFPLWRKVGVYPAYMATIRIMQRRSLQDADAVMIAPYQLPALQRTCPGKELFFLNHFLDVSEDYGNLAARREASARYLCREIGAEGYFFSSVRHFWKSHADALSDNKRNDIILRAFRHYVGWTGEKGYKLILVKKGPDLDASMELCRELGIESRTVWIDPVPRDQLQEYYRGAALCFGQFGTPVINFAVLEPLANGGLCVTHLGDADREVPNYRVLPPVFNETAPESIAATMKDVAENSGKYEDRRYESWQWASENCSERAFVVSFKKTFGIQP